jgi:hypothetical protein
MIVSSVSFCRSAFAWYPSSPVLFLILLARVCRILAADVSGMMNHPPIPNTAAMINVIQDVHLHPRLDSVIKPPAIGPATGPANPPAAKRQMA